MSAIEQLPVESQPPMEVLEPIPTEVMIEYARLELRERDRSADPVPPEPTLEELKRELMKTKQELLREQHISMGITSVFLFVFFAAILLAVTRPNCSSPDVGSLAANLTVAATTHWEGY